MDNSKLILWWDSELKSGQTSNVRFNYDVLDTFLRDKPIASSIRIKIIP